VELAEALRALNVERYVLVAHSYGGAVALALAGGEPEPGEGVLLLGGAGGCAACERGAGSEVPAPGRQDRPLDA